MVQNVVLYCTFIRSLFFTDSSVQIHSLDAFDICQQEGKQLCPALLNDDNYGYDNQFVWTRDGCDFEPHQPTSYPTSVTDTPANIHTNQPTSDPPNNPTPSATPSPFFAP